MMNMCKALALWELNNVSIQWLFKQDAILDKVWGLGIW